MLNDSFLIFLDALSKLIVILGFPLAYIQYRISKRKERRDREYGTYNALDEKYLEFQNLCLQYPYLDIFDIPDPKPIELTNAQRKEELILFTILFSIFERAFLLYSDQRSTIKEKQWTGWEFYIKAYCGRPNFLSAWRVSGYTFDKDFEEYMNSVILTQEKLIEH